MMSVYLVLFLCYISCGINNAYEYETFYFDQQVDHFSYSNDDHFKQRYLLNTDHYDTEGNGTIFVYAGNEGNIEMFANNTGFMWENAALFNAAIVFIEHRYYGFSLPYGAFSFDNLTYLGYLNTAQALADYASIITYLKINLDAEKVPIIMFGGSYGGMLAAWMRMKYPNLVHGVVSSSAPILGVGDECDCNKFVKVATKVFLDDGGKECVESIRKSWAVLRRNYSEAGGMKRLMKAFHLCENDPCSIDGLIHWLSDTWFYLAMTNYPYPTNFLKPIPGFPVKEACKYLTNSSVPDEEIIYNIYKAASVFHNYTGKVNCFNYTESGGKLLGMIAWDFQACAELVLPQCQTGVTDMFEPLKWNYTAYSEECFEEYGVHSDEYRAVWMYGGHNLKLYSNIIFTNGLKDPWYPNGVLRTVSDTVVAIVMENAAHHLDLRASNPADPVSVIEGRHLILNYIWQFVNETRLNFEMDM